MWVAMILPLPPSTSEKPIQLKEQDIKELKAKIHPHLGETKAHHI